MRRSFVGAAFTVAALAALPASAQQAQKGGSDDFGPYNVVPGWLKPIKPGYLEKGVAVFAESPDRIFITTSVEFMDPTKCRAPGGRAGGGGGGGGGAGRGGAAELPPCAPPKNAPKILVADRNGNIKEEWSQWADSMDMPHYVIESPYDPAPRPVWVVSRETDRVFKFSNDGKKLLMVLGTDRARQPLCPEPQGKAKCLVASRDGKRHLIQQDENHFGQPTEVAFLPDGSFYLSDGYTNRHILHFDKNGKKIAEWGGVGTGPGQFADDGQVHGVGIDADRKIYIADRGNSRVQIFDENGKYLDEWDNILAVSDIEPMKDGKYLAISGQGNRLLTYDKNGKLLTYWGTAGQGAGQFDDPHYFSVDQEGNLYVAIFSSTKVGVEKYVPKPGADKSRLISAYPPLLTPKTQDNQR
jgi:DNA-binding beta-propeller fold protein YncE